MTQSAALPRIDPYADEFQQDPFPAYEALRRAAPVHEVAGHGFYLVTTMPLVREALRDPETYANSVTSVRRTEPSPEIAAEVDRIRAQGFAYRPALGLSDPPRHTRNRALVQRAFTPRALAWMDPVVTQISRDLVAALPAGGVINIVPAVARPLPIYAICRILGLPDAWRDDIARWSDAATASLGAKPLVAERWLTAERDMIDYQRRLVAELDLRRATPRDDLLSALVQPDPEHGALTNNDLVWFVRELIVAGNETTTKLITDMVLRLSEAPERWRQLRDDPRRAATLVEEGLRLASPVQGMFRRVTRATTLGGVPLPEGAIVFLSFISANRDRTVFDSPDDFNPDRPHARKHVSFGQGIHSCLGNVLARMEAAAVLRDLAERVDRLEVVDPGAVRYLPSFVLRGIPALPVRVHPHGGA